LSSDSTDILSKAVSASVKMPGGPFGRDAAVRLITEGGSDRAFYRVADGDRTAVLLIDEPAELERYHSICRFLRDSGVPTPVCYGIDEGTGALLMEDLGSLSLDRALTAAEPEEELRLYRSCIDILVTMGAGVTERMLDTGFLEEKSFDMQALLGETDYFREEFLGKYCPVRLDRGWEEERRTLASFLASQTPVFMHRDFQSRNLIVKEGEIRVIDFQTAHRGPGLYDAAALLKDPYHPLPPGRRYSLLEELHDLLKERGGPVCDDFEKYREGFVLAGIQRNLQALAAYVRLGVVKGKREFLESIPPALDLLEEGIDESGRLPAMKRMVIAIREISEKGHE
jgi:aminoglycoside/choline kinase family phosphotransferase